MVRLKEAAIGGVTRSSFGTNSSAAARPPGFIDERTFFSSSTHVGTSKWCRKFVSRTTS